MGTEAQIAWYRQRRNEGVCVRCGLKAMVKMDGTPGAYCPTHYRMQQESGRASVKRGIDGKPDDGLCAIYGDRQEPREAFWPAPKVLPPLPDKCPRCGSMVVHVEIEIYLEYVDGIRCPCCGFLTDRQMLQNKLDAEHGAHDEPELGEPVGGEGQEAV